MNKNNNTKRCWWISFFQTNYFQNFVVWHLNFLKKQVILEEPYSENKLLWKNPSLIIVMNFPPALSSIIDTSLFYPSDLNTTTAQPLLTKVFPDYGYGQVRHKLSEGAVWLLLSHVTWQWHGVNGSHRPGFYFGWY